MRIFRRQRNTTAAEATRARIRAERELERVKSETPLYRELALALVRVQQRNNLADHAIQIFRGET